jgi:SiaC family regulatory phosphoprotein
MKEFKKLLIEQTIKTPKIDLNHFSGELILSGKSIPENAAIIYEPVFNWINEYILQANPTTNLRLSLEYFNTSSSIWISIILKSLTQINNPDYLLLVHLYLPLEEYNDIKEFDDINDACNAITNIFQNSIPCVGLKLYATNDKSEIVKDALVLM